MKNKILVFDEIDKKYFFDYCGKFYKTLVFKGKKFRIKMKSPSGSLYYFDENNEYMVRISDHWSSGSGVKKPVGFIGKNYFVLKKTDGFVSLSSEKAGIAKISNACDASKIRDRGKETADCIVFNRVRDFRNKYIRGLVERRRFMIISNIIREAEDILSKQEYVIQGNKEWVKEEIALNFAKEMFGVEIPLVEKSLQLKLMDMLSGDGIDLGLDKEKVKRFYRFKLKFLYFGMSRFKFYIEWFRRCYEKDC